MVLPGGWGSVDACHQAGTTPCSSMKYSSKMNYQQFILGFFTALNSGVYLGFSILVTWSWGASIAPSCHSYILGQQNSTCFVLSDNHLCLILSATWCGLPWCSFQNLVFTVIILIITHLMLIYFCSKLFSRVGIVVCLFWVGVKVS